MLSCNDCLENGVVIKYVITINTARRKVMELPETFNATFVNISKMFSAFYK